ncbi:MAG: lysophospholipid acyltransferase family protein [Leptospirillia bacterium]
MKKSWVITKLYLQLLLEGAHAFLSLLFVRMTGADRVLPWLQDRAARWARRAVRISGGRVRVEGLEKIPTDGPVLYVANHQGVFDIPIMMGHLPGSPAFVAKKELFRIPLLGYWMKRIGCIGLDRENPRVAIQQIKDAAEGVKGGRRMVLFPEGTRSRAADGAMGPFKRGSLKLAFLADAQVVPVTVEGSRFLLSSEWPNGFTGDVKLIISDPVAVAELDAEAQKALPDVLHDLISENRKRHHLGAISSEVVAL